MAAQLTFQTAGKEPHALDAVHWLERSVFQGIAATSAQFVVEATHRSAVLLICCAAAPGEPATLASLAGYLLYTTHALTVDINKLAVSPSHRCEPSTCKSVQLEACF